MSITPKEKRTTGVDLPRVKQSLALICSKCGTKQSYDVGTVFLQKRTDGTWTFQFTNYFRCLHCDSPGPFEVADHLKLIAEVIAGKERGDPKVFLGRVELFDGAAHQTVAMSEEYLKKLSAKDTNNAFLYVRLGNLMRASRNEGAAIEWYERALALDPHELEALGSLKELRIQRGDYGPALRYSWTILEAVEAGRRAVTEELTRGILSAALYVMNEYEDDFRAAWHALPEEIRDSRSGGILHEFMTVDANLDGRVHLFVNATLGEKADDESVADEVEADEAFDLASETEWSRAKRKPWPSSSLRPVEMEASLSALVAGSGMDWTRLRPALPTGADGVVAIPSRHTIGLTDGERAGLWNVPSLRALFRGNRQPPPAAEMERYPADYVDLFYCVEYQALVMADADRDPTDEEFIELYSAMRRRPDGRSLGPLHDVVWQAACLALGMTQVSEAEFSAVFSQLTRSARHFRVGHTSRNYVGYLRSTFSC